MKRDSASNPLAERYASREMSYLFSPDYKFRTWRRLWIALAQAEQELGLPITDAQIAELKAHANDINYEDAERREREIRHDVMSHIYAWGLQAPSAKGIIHLGATSAFVTDNTEILQMAEGLAIMQSRIVNLMAKLRDFAWKWRATPQLACNSRERRREALAERQEPTANTKARSHEEEMLFFVSSRFRDRLIVLALW